MSASTNPPIRLLMKFEQLFPSNPAQMVVRAPGREMWAAVRFNGAHHVNVYSADSDGRASFSYQSAKRRETIHHRPLPLWARYIAGVSVLVDVAEMPGIDAVVCGDEPAGPRYEFALGILFAAVWYEINALPFIPKDLIDITEQARREYVEV